MRRLLGAIVVCATVVAVLAGATPDASASGSAKTTAAIRLVEMNPWVEAHDTVDVAVRVVGAPVGATLTPTLHRAVTTRSSFALTVDGHDLGDAAARFADHDVHGSSASITVRFRVDDGAAPADADAATADGDSVTLTRPGVYPLVFTLDDADGAEVASMVTYIVRLPSSPTEGDGGRRPLRVASEFRLQPRPQTTAAGDLVVTEAARRSTDEFVDGLGDASTTVRRSFGFAVSPAYLDALAATHDTRDLARLAALVDGLPLQTQPWAPLDPAGWLATPDLAPAVDRASVAGTEVLGEYLQPPAVATADLAAWGGRISEQSLRWFAEQGATSVLIPADALVGLDTDDFPRSLAAPFHLDTGGATPLTAMQLDPAIAAHFTAADPVLGANQLIADLSVIALDLPAISRAMVVAPPAGWHPSAALLSAYTAALASAHPAGSDPLLAPTPLATVIDTTPAVRAGGDTATEGPTLLRSLRRTDPPPPMTELGNRFAKANALVDSLATMVPGGTARSALEIERLRRQISVAAMPGTTETERNRRFAAVGAQVGTAVDAVRLPPRQTITLTSDTASLPVTIRRPEDGPTEVVVHIDAPDRLRFPDGTDQAVHLDATTTRFSVRVHSDSPGDTIVRMTVTSPDGELVVGTTELVVRSTAASGVGFVISFGSLAFLIVWWARDIIRTRRRRRADHIPPAELIDID